MMSKKATIALVAAATLGVLAPAQVPQATAAPQTEMWLQNSLVYNSPISAKAGIEQRIVLLTKNTPAGEKIQVNLYFLGSKEIKDELARAFKRGVDVQVVASADTKKEYPQIKKLAKALNRDSSDNSWVKWTKGSVTGANGYRAVAHQKSFLFSKVITRPYVVLAGSYNPSDKSHEKAYSMMLQTVGNKGIYDAFQERFINRSRDNKDARGLRKSQGPGWDAYFMPGAITSEQNDPVVQRLKALPANENTRIKIAMYAWWDDRGIWIAKQVAALRSKGATVTVLAGPSVSSTVKNILTNAGVTVLDGTFDNGNYTHSKDMSATWVVDGKRHYKVWTGSDNWTSQSTYNDDASFGIESETVFNQFKRAFDKQAKHK